MKKKKLLILSASTGSGHVQAARALEQYAQTHYKDIEVKHIDIADYLSYPLKKTFVDSYSLMIKTLPELWGLLYKQSDRPNTNKYLSTLMRFIKQINTSELYRMIQEFEPDSLLYTHFLGHYLVDAAPEKWGLTMPTSMLFTDYAIHNILVIPELTHFFVPTEKMKWVIENHQNVSPDQVTISGIPVKPAFRKKINKTAVKKFFDVPKGKPIMLVLAGGYGLSKSDAILKTLFTLDLPVHFIAVAGKNDRLHRKLEKLEPPNQHSLTVLGWTDRMHELVHISNAVISKPGGITLTECHTVGIPLIAINPIPGQEDRNAHHMLEHNWGYLAHDPNDLKYYATKIAQSKKTKHAPPIPAAKIIFETLRKKELL